jgi:Cu+-exporting ATPase
MITGESMPVSKKTGDKVLGGTTNLQGLIYVQAINVGEETAIGKIAKLVSNGYNYQKSL